MIRSFGQVCVIGVMACYLVALVSVPAVGLLTNYRPKAIAHGTTRSGSEKPTVEETYNNLLGRLASKVARHPVPVLVLVGLVALVGFSLDGEIPISTDEDTFVPKDMPALINLREGEPDHGLDRVHADLRPGRPRPLARGDPMDARVPGVRALAQLEHPRRELDRDRDRRRRTAAPCRRRRARSTRPSSLIPEATQRQFISGSTEAVIAFSTVEMSNTKGHVHDRAAPEGARLDGAAARDHRDRHRPGRDVHEPDPGDRGRQDLP